MTRATSFLAGIVLVGFCGALAIVDPDPHFVVAKAIIDAALANQDPLVPDDALTPGVVASTDQTEVCGIIGGLSYSKRHRATSNEMKTAVRERDGKASCGEIDHRLPLALGGADDTRNLWCQPTGEWGYKVKDRLEIRVWEMVCKEGAMTLHDAQTLFLAPADWREGYRKVFGQ